MNAPFNIQIQDFITDFKLREEDSVMHFNAKVLYLVKSVPHLYECPVAIVTIHAKKLDAIYILNSQLKEDGFEEMFVIDKEKINYEKNKYLLLERNRHLKVFIFHINSISSPKKVLQSMSALSKEENNNHL